MSIVHTFDPDALTDMLKVGAGIGVGFVAHWFWLRGREAEVAWGMGLIARFRDGNDDWEERHRAEFAAAELPPPAELPALSDQAHEDEQAPNEDDYHAGGWWLPVMTLPLLLARLWGYLLEYCAEQVRLIRELASRPQPEVPMVSGADLAEQMRYVGFTDDEIRDELGETDAEAFAVEVAEIRKAEGLPPRVRGIYRPTSELPLVRLDPTKIVGRHRLVKSEPVKAGPQRDGEVPA